MENKQNNSILYNTDQSFNQCQKSNRNLLTFQTHSSQVNKFPVIASLYKKSQDFLSQQFGATTENIEKLKSIFQQQTKNTYKGTQSCFEQLQKIQHENTLHVKNLPLFMNCKEKQMFKLLSEKVLKDGFIEANDDIEKIQQKVLNQAKKNQEKLQELRGKFSDIKNMHEEQINQLVSILDRSLSQIENTVQQCGVEAAEASLKLESDFLTMATTIDCKVQSEIEEGKRDQALTFRLVDRLIEKMTLI